MSKHIAVIGAGIAGLTCAYELQNLGYEVVVYEKESIVGGRMASRTKDGFIFDIGADHLCNLYDDIIAYCNEFGIHWEKMKFLKYQLFKNGKLIAPSQAVSPFLRFRLFLQYLKKRKSLDFFNLNKVIQYDTDNAYDFMAKEVGKDVADYLIDPFTTTYQFHRAKEISLGAMFGIMESIHNEHSRWYLHRTKGGMRALPDALAKNLNVKHEAVTEVFQEDGNIKVKTASQEEQFDATVLATTADITKNILRNPTEPQKTLIENTEYATTISTSFKVDAALMPDTSIIWVPYVENTKISGYVNESMKGEEVVRNGKTLISVWLHEDFAKSIINKSDEEIFRAVKEELPKVCPWFTSKSQLNNHDLHRWPAAMPKFSQGHLTRVADFLENNQGENNIFLCGDYLNSPWTEGALRCGKRTATQVSEHLSSPDQ